MGPRIVVKSLFYYSDDPHRRYCRDTFHALDIDIRPSGIPLKFASPESALTVSNPFHIFSRYRWTTTRSLGWPVYTYPFEMHLFPSIIAKSATVLASDLETCCSCS